MVNGYTEYDSIKVKLRVSDDTMKEEIEIYMHDIDDLVDNRLRNKLGKYNIYGSEITLPLDTTTIPPIPAELKGIANDLVVAKIRLQNAEKPLLWDAEVKRLDNYLDMVYGWTRDVPYQPTRTLVISPTTGSPTDTITLSGTNFQPVIKLNIVFDHTNPVTIPVDVITDDKGIFSATFDIPVTQNTGAYKIKVADRFGGIERNFEVV